VIARPLITLDVAGAVRRANRPTRPDAIIKLETQ